MGRHDYTLPIIALFYQWRGAIVARRSGGQYPPDKFGHANKTKPKMLT